MVLNKSRNGTQHNGGVILTSKYKSIYEIFSTRKITEILVENTEIFKNFEKKLEKTIDICCVHSIFSLYCSSSDGVLSDQFEWKISDFLKKSYFI